MAVGRFQRTSIPEVNFISIGDLRLEMSCAGRERGVTTIGSACYLPSVSRKKKRTLVQITPFGLTVNINPIFGKESGLRD